MVFGREWKNKTEQANNIITRCKLLGLGKWIYHPQKQWVGKRKLKKFINLLRVSSSRLISKISTI